MTGDNAPPDGRGGVGRRRVLRGVAGVAGTAGAAGVASAQQAPYGGWFTSSAKGGATKNYTGSTVDRTGKDAVTVEVGAQGNGGTYAFAPPAIRVDPGTTVTFEWVSDTHNVVVESQPDGAGWKGVSKIHDTGFTHEHTFETKGIYKYYCDPHLSLGMKGAVVVGDATVGETGGAGSGGGGGGGIGPLPGGQGGAFIMLSLFATGALGALVVFAGEIRAMLDRRPSSEELGPPTAAPEREPAVEIGHHEFDPNGTLTLVLVYFAILLVMWVFTYFVEFLGRGPTVIG